MSRWQIDNAPDCKSAKRGLIPLRDSTRIWGMGLLGVDTCFASRKQIGSNPIFSTKIRSRSVHGRTSHCHCDRRGSLPLQTAKLRGKESKRRMGKSVATDWIPHLPQLQYCPCSSEEEQCVDNAQADISKLSKGTSFRIVTAKSKLTLFMSSDKNYPVVFYII